jgi:predicted dehydrogenase
VVGLGFGPVHVAAFRRDPRCEVVALCARREDRAEEAARRLAISRALGDWRRLLDEKAGVDLISLAVPGPVQAEIGRAALQAGKHVLFEKPLADSAEAANELALMADKLGRATAVNFEFPEGPAWHEAKRVLDEGRIGRLRHVVVTWRVETYANKARLDSWKTRSAEGGGAMNLFTSHCFHYVEWLFGPVRSISAALQRAPGDGRDGDTLDGIVLITEDGVPIVLTIATDAFLGSGHRLDLCGDDGTLVLENREADYIRGFRLFLAERKDRELQPQPVSDVPGTEDGRIAATAAIVHRLLDVVTRGEGRVTPGVREGARVQQLIDAARVSSREGRVVAVSSNAPGDGLGGT